MARANTKIYIAISSYNIKSKIKSNKEVCNYENN